MDKLLTDEELEWLRQILKVYDATNIEISPSYFYRKKVLMEREQNKETTRKELDVLRNASFVATPEDLFKLRGKTERSDLGVSNFSGIYIIHNTNLDIYYVGQAKKVFDRAYTHFESYGGNQAIYQDYKLGHEFLISLIDVRDTSYNSLNELEDNAIRAYGSFHNGYNRMPGNVMDKPIFQNDDYEKAAYLLLDRLKDTKAFLELSNARKRLNFVLILLRDYELPRDNAFAIQFAQLITAYHKANRKDIKEQLAKT